MHKHSLGGRAPDPAGHARALVDAYGLDTALLLARAHAAGQAPGAYWTRLVTALAALSSPAPEPPTQGGAADRKVPLSTSRPAKRESAA
jgi:hypothetical protein